MPMIGSLTITGAQDSTSTKFPSNAFSLMSVPLLLSLLSHTTEIVNALEDRDRNK